MSPVRRATRPELPRGRTARVEACVTPELRSDCERAAAVAGYPSVSAWMAAVLVREIELLDWSEGGAGNEPTPVPSGTTRAALATLPPEKP